MPLPCSARAGRMKQDWNFAKKTQCGDVSQVVEHKGVYRRQHISDALVTALPSPGVSGNRYTAGERSTRE